ncbi:MAG: hypothetical protein IJ940_05800 [Bacteroidales bacterium]|nr:hypothetical protein [Bacteroidales bacterium]
MKRILLIASIIALAGCNRFDIDEILLQRDDLSLTIRGEVIFSYDPGTCQLGYNPESSTFRTYSDDLGHWFILTCRSSPDTEGQSVKADIEYTSQTDTKTIRNLEFTVKKNDRAGKIWLWNDERKIGVVVKRL